MGAKNRCVKKSRRKRVNRLNIATNNVRTLLKDERVQEPEELMEARLLWDVIRIGEARKREECFTTLQRGHLLYHSKANNSQREVDFLINRKWKDHKVRVNSICPRVAELVLCITKRYKLKIMQVYSLATSYSEKGINSFYNAVDEARKAKPLHDSDGRLQYAHQVKNTPYGNGNGQI